MARSSDASGSDAGAAYLLLGPVSGESSLGAADAKLTGEASGDYAGSSVSGGRRRWRRARRPDRRRRLREHARNAGAAYLLLGVGL